MGGVVMGGVALERGKGSLLDYSFAGLLWID